MKIIWQETSESVLTDKNIKTIAIGKGFAEYEGNFNDEQFLEFLNFQFSRFSVNKIKIISLDSISEIDNNK